MHKRMARDDKNPVAQCPIYRIVCLTVGKSIRSDTENRHFNAVIERNRFSIEIKRQIFMYDFRGIIVVIIGICRIIV